MKTAAASTDVMDARVAGRQLATQIQEGLDGKPQAIMLFAAPSYDHAALLDELASQFPEALLVGASSAGEFTNQTRGEGLACAFGLAGEDVRFGVGVRHGWVPASASDRVTEADGTRLISLNGLPAAEAFAAHAKATSQNLDHGSPIPNPRRKADCERSPPRLLGSASAPLAGLAEEITIVEVLKATMERRDAVLLGE